MAGSGSSPKGAVDGDSSFTSGGVGVPPVASHGQEVRGGRSGAHTVLEKEEERG
jgi:hypothetical protein